MNLMHGDLKVTDGIYAPLLGDEVKSRIASLGQRPMTAHTDSSDVAQCLRRLSRGQMVEALHILADAMARCWLTGRSLSQMPVAAGLARWWTRSTSACARRA